MNTAITCLTAPVMATLTGSPNELGRDLARDAILASAFNVPAEGQTPPPLFFEHNLGRLADLIDQAELFQTANRSDGFSRPQPHEHAALHCFESIALFSVTVSGLRH